MYSKSYLTAVLIELGKRQALLVAEHKVQEETKTWVDELATTYKPEEYPMMPCDKRRKRKGERKRDGWRLK